MTGLRICGACQGIGWHTKGCRYYGSVSDHIVALTAHLLENQTELENQTFTRKVTKSSPKVENQTKHEIQTNLEKQTHGGKRAGAGRKPYGLVAMTGAEQRRLHRQKVKEGR